MGASDVVRLSTGISVEVPRKRPAPQESNESSHRLMEKVNNVWGSTAGAGSDFFHTYRKHRATEMQRLKQLDEEYEDEKEAEEFQKKREELMRLNEARSAKSSAKRQHIKQRRKQIRELKKRGAELNSFSNDGSFLTEFLNCQQSTKSSCPHPVTTSPDATVKDATIKDATNATAMIEDRMEVNTGQASSDQPINRTNFRIVEEDLF